jgi:hypothetical protein
MGYAYLLHVNIMPGNFADQDTTRVKEKQQILHSDKQQRNHNTKNLTLKHKKDK